MPFISDVQNRQNPRGGNRLVVRRQQGVRRDYNWPQAAFGSWIEFTQHTDILKPTRMYLKMLMMLVFMLCTYYCN